MPRNNVDMCRFTAWIAESERLALDRIADRENCSVNLLVRTAIRDFLRKESQVSHVTTSDLPDAA